MIKIIIKRNGTKEPFSADKINKWGEWASETLGIHVDWSYVVTHTVSTCDEEVTSRFLQKRLIATCLDQQTWSYYRMAGRLYAAYLQKKIHGDHIPTIESVHNRLAKEGLMRYLDYTPKEYAFIETFIDHERDFGAAHFELHQIREKYSLHNKVTKQEWETCQFVYMRMAMALAEDEPQDRRLDEVRNFYEEFSHKRINAPTPNYVNLGTPLYGLASCCLYKTNDNSMSLAIGDHIAYIMTCMSAGIGSNIDTRNLGEAVRGGAIEHQGRLPYYRALDGAIHANLQNGRGGAANTFYPPFNAEAQTIARLKNPMSIQEKQIKGLDYAMIVSKFFAKKAAKNEDIFVFSSNTAPDLYDAFYSGDNKLFAEIYEKYAQDDSFEKEWISARELIITAMTESYEVGQHYFMFVDEVNYHTPFKDPIYSSNLCVAGDTRLLTDQGNVEIKELEGQEVTVWNGEGWSTVPVVKTNDSAPMIKVVVTSGEELTCTPYHKFYLSDGTEVRAGELEPGQHLLNQRHPYDSRLNTCHVVDSVKDEGVVGATYCVREPKRHMAVFNGILTGQCMEIMTPTKGYDSMMDLYSEEDHGRGEVGICTIGGVVISNIHSDAQYYRSMYYGLKMIDKCIHQAEYRLPHIGVTSKARMNAGMGIMGLAHHMARKGFRYSSEEGKQELHRVAERHMYFALEASLKLGQEVGNAPWMHKTKWPEGYLPIDTYNRNVDSITDFDYVYDWENLRGRIKDNGGIRFSVNVAHMPGESSSKGSGATNSLYPIRDYTLMKTDNQVVTAWAAPEGEELAGRYELAWDIPTKDMIDCYAIFQKFTDQGISADLYRRMQGADTVGTTEMLSDFFYMAKMGLKSRYYQNSLTAKGVNLQTGEVEYEEQVGDVNCGSDGCAL